MTDEADFDAFVVARSQALLRTAYLLVQDEGLAEDLRADGADQGLVRLEGHQDEPGGLRPPDHGHHVGVLVAATVDARDAHRGPARATLRIRPASPRTHRTSGTRSDACRAGNERSSFSATWRTAPSRRPRSCSAARSAR